MLNHLLIILVLTLSLAFGIWRKPWRREFFLAGRKAGAPQVAGSILATCLGGSAVFGLVGTASQIGWSAFWWLGAGSFGVFLLGLAWASAMRRRPEQITLPQWLGGEYGRPARVLAALLIAIMWCGVIAAQWVAAGALLGSLAGWPLAYGIVAVSGVTVLYTAIGGQASVLRTDLLQAAATIGALLLVLVFLLFKAEGADLIASLPHLTGHSEVPAGFSLSFYEWLSLMVVIGGMYLVGPDLYSRVATADSVTSARRGAFAAALGLLLCGVLVTYLGVFAGNVGGESVIAREALVRLIGEWLPSSLAILVQAALLTALISSADTCLLTAGSVLQLDLVKSGSNSGQEATILTRLWIVAVGGLSTAVAIVSPRIIGNIMLAYAFYAGGLLVPLLLLRFPVSGRLSRPWIWLAMGLGGLLPLACLLFDWFPAEDFMLRQAKAGMSGVVLSSVICLIGAAAAGRPPPAPEQGDACVH